MRVFNSKVEEILQHKLVKEKKEKGRKDERMPKKE